MWKSLSHRIDLLRERVGERFTLLRVSLSGYSPFREWKLWVFLTVLSLAGYLLCGRVAVAV